MATLSDKLKSKKKNSRVIFLELKDEIVEAINSGYTAKAVWTQLKEDEIFTYNYPLFIRYFNKFCSDKEPNEKPKPQKQTVAASRKTASSTDRIQTNKSSGPLIGGSEKTGSFGYDGKPKSDDELF